MKKHVLRSLFYLCLAIVTVFLLLGCTTQMKIIVDRADVQYDFKPKPADHEIKVLEVDDALPPRALLIAKMKLRDTGLTVDCGYTDVLKKATDKARELGGDLMQVLQVYPPDIVSSCYQLDVAVYALPAVGKQD